MEFRLSHIKGFVKRFNIGCWDGTHRDPYTSAKVKTRLRDFYNYPSLFLFVERDGVAEYMYCKIKDDKFIVGDTHDLMHRDYTTEWIEYLMMEARRKEEQKMRKFNLTNIKEFLEEIDVGEWNGYIYDYINKTRRLATLKDFKAGVASLPVVKDDKEELIRVVVTDAYIKIVSQTQDEKMKQISPTQTKIYTAEWKNFINNQLNQLSFDF